MRAAVTVMLKDGILDPQGKAIEHALHTLGFSGVSDVRAGKVIAFDVAAADAAEARKHAEDMARRLLANAVIESFKVEIMP
jgi:phosphoribosylformylglycinamidine synthase PurS subunit